MNEWKRSQKAERVTFLPDGNGEFSDKMGLLVGKEDLGFGKRSWRYSMLVRDGVIEKMFIEPEEPGDPYHVSDADTMLKHLDPEGEFPHDVAIFSREGCPFCARAKDLLEELAWSMKSSFSTVTTRTGPCALFRKASPTRRCSSTANRSVVQTILRSGWQTGLLTKQPKQAPRRVPPPSAPRQIGPPS